MVGTECFDASAAKLLQQMDRPRLPHDTKNRVFVGDTVQHMASSAFGRSVEQQAKSRYKVALICVDCFERCDISVVKKLAQDTPFEYAGKHRHYIYIA